MKKQRLTRGYTMNGIPFDEAEKMVLEFLDDRNSSKTTTSIWFPTAFVTQILTAVEKDGIDGVRFYFAKDQLKNTVVPVATKEGPNMSTRHGRLVHIDFFEFSEPLTRFNAEANYDENGLYKMVCDGKNCDTTASSIPCTTAVEWAKSFKRDHADSDEIINTTSVWYPISFFERLAYKLDAAARDGELKPDGIRLYFIRNKQHRDGFVFFTTHELNNLHIDNVECYDVDPNNVDPRLFLKFITVGGTPDDRGEECPIFCPGTTWSDCELP